VYRRVRREHAQVHRAACGEQHLRAVPVISDGLAVDADELVTNGELALQSDALGTCTAHADRDASRVTNECISRASVRCTLSTERYNAVTRALCERCHRHSAP
jgi:hypothetical protein